LPSRPKTFNGGGGLYSTAGDYVRFIANTDDDALFQTILRAESNISGLQDKLLRRFLPHLNSGQVSRLLKRLRLNGLINKVAHGYKYYVTTFGKDVLTAGLKLRELVIIRTWPTTALPNMLFLPASRRIWI